MKSSKVVKFVYEEFSPLIAESYKLYGEWDEVTAELYSALDERHIENFEFPEHVTGFCDFGDNQSTEFDIVLQRSENLNSFIAEAIRQTFGIQLANMWDCKQITKLTKQQVLALKPAIEDMLVSVNEYMEENISETKLLLASIVEKDAI